MRNVTFAALFLAACGSIGAKAPVTEPEILVEQLSTVAPAAIRISGNISLQYRVTIHNVSDTPLTLTRVDLNSIGAGAYTLNATSRSFNLPIAPGATQSVEFWTSGTVDPTILGADGPVTLRAVAGFDSAKGSFQSVVTQQVHATPLG